MTHMVCCVRLHGEMQLTTYTQSVDQVSEAEQVCDFIFVKEDSQLEIINTTILLHCKTEEGKWKREGSSISHFYWWMPKWDQQIQSLVAKLCNLVY